MRRRRNRGRGKTGVARQTEKLKFPSRWDLQRLREEQQLQRLRARQEKQILSINQIKKEDTPSILPNLEVGLVFRTQS